MKLYQFPFAPNPAKVRLYLAEKAELGCEIPVEEVTARNHEVIHESSGRSAGFGELAEAASQLEVPAADTLTLSFGYDRGNTR